MADHLGNSDHEVFMWSREARFVEYFNKHQRNPDYLKDHEFSTNIRVVGPEIPSKEMMKQMDVLLFAIPTQGVRETLIKLQHSFDRANLPLMIFVNKGIETDTQALTLEIIADTCGSEIARAATFIVSVVLSADFRCRDSGSSLDHHLQRKVGSDFETNHASS